MQSASDTGRMMNHTGKCMRVSGYALITELGYLNQVPHSSSMCYLQTQNLKWELDIECFVMSKLPVWENKEGSTKAEPKEHRALLTDPYLDPAQRQSPINP